MSILGLFVKNPCECQSVGLYMGPQFCFIDQWVFSLNDSTINTIVMYYNLKSDG